MREKIIIDTDPALGVFGRDIDDGLAIVLALHSPEVEVVGITVTHGNVDLKRALASARRVLKAAGREDIPVMAGAASRRELGKSTEASEFISRRLEGEKGEITLVAIGPLTNVATAEKTDPGVLSLAKRIVCMGGAVWCRGMITPAMRAEFNFWKDPEAADVFIRGAENLTLVPWDLTKTVIVEMPRLIRLKLGGAPISDFLYKHATSWFAVSTPVALAYTGRAGFMPHDPLAVGVLLWPDIYQYRHEKLSIITSGAARGAVNISPQGSSVRVAYSVQERQFLDSFIRRLISPVPDGEEPA